MSLILGRELIVVGEGIELLVEPVPDHLVGKPLASSEIGSNSGLNVIGIRVDGEFKANPTASMELTEGAELVMIGTSQQRQRFLAMKNG